jgi:hypothetical protein
VIAGDIVSLFQDYPHVMVESSNSYYAIYSGIRLAHTDVEKCNTWIAKKQLAIMFCQYDVLSWQLIRKIFHNLW